VSLARWRKIAFTVLMQNLVSGELSIEWDHSPPDPVRLHWRGKSNQMSPGLVLDPFLALALDEAEQSRVALEMHFEQIEHFNSSTITALLRLLEDARQRSVRVVLVYSSARKWQRVSFEGLRVFTTDGNLELRSV
jgi:hypothetical protein